MKTLNLLAIDQIDHLARPEEMEPLTYESAALCIFTDFRDNQPFVIDASSPAIEAESLMIKAHVKLKIVVNHEDEFLGVVSLADISNENIIRHVAEGLSREEVRVGDLMQPKASLKAFAYSQIEHATVADVMAALQLNGLQHCLIVDTDQHVIRGLISASDIARKLKIPLSLTVQPTFAAIFDAVNSTHAGRKHLKSA
jgi:CBS domain-containing protein